MPKNIVILCDGTSNEISEDRSNILRLYGTLSKSADQIVFYDPGVGTFGSSNAWSYYYRKALEIWGLALVGASITTSRKPTNFLLSIMMTASEAMAMMLPRIRYFFSVSVGVPIRPGFLPVYSCHWFD